MATTAKVIISAEDQTSKGISSAKSNVDSFSSSTSKLGETLTKAFAVTAIIEGVKKLGEAAFSCMEDFAGVERTMIQLKTALGGNEVGFRQMTSLIDESAEKTLESKDAVEKLVAEMANLYGPDQTAKIERVTQATIAYSNVTGKDLNSSFQLINSTYSGTAGKLEKLDSSFASLTKTELESGKAVDLIIEKYGKTSDAMAGGLAQELNNIKLSFDDVKESMGSLLAMSFEPLIKSAGEAAKKISEAFSKAATNTANQNAYERTGALPSNYEDAKSLYDNLNDQKSAMLKMFSFGNPNENTADALKLVSPSFVKLTDEMEKLEKVMPYLGQGSAFNASFKPSNSNVDKSNPEYEKLVKSNYKKLEEFLANYNETLTKANALGKEAGDERVKRVDEEYVKFTAIISNIDLGPQGKELKSKIETMLMDSLKEAHTPTNQSGYSVTTSNLLQSFSGGDSSGSSSVHDNFGGLGNSFGSLFSQLSDVFAPVTSALSPVISLLTSADPVLQIIMLALQGTAQVLAPAINQIISPFFSSIKQLGAELGKQLLPILDALSPVFSIIGQIITNNLIPVLNILSPFIQVIAVILSTVLNPILKSVAVAFEVLMSPVKYISDLFKWVGSVIEVFGRNVQKWMNLDFKHNESAGAFSSDAFTGLADRVKKIWETNYSTNTYGGTVTTGISGTSSISSSGTASYTGGNNTYILNINAPVYGNGGEQQLFADFTSYIKTQGYYARS
jgi:phage-related protein